MRSTRGAIRSARPPQGGSRAPYPSRPRSAPTRWRPSRNHHRPRRADDDDDDDASLGHLRARNAELRERLREASDDLARARERETAVSGALRAFRERQEKLTRELSSAAATEAEVRRAHERCAELEIEATSRDVETREATRRAEDAESRLAATAVELDETKARLAELVELRAKPVPASPSRSSSSSGRAAESVRDIIVAAAEAAASRKRGLLNGAPKGKGTRRPKTRSRPSKNRKSSSDAFTREWRKRWSQAQREWRSEMDAMDAERCAEVASLRDALARLRAESDEERLEIDSTVRVTKRREPTPPKRGRSWRRNASHRRSAPPLRPPPSSRRNATGPRRSWRNWRRCGASASRLKRSG